MLVPLQLQLVLFNMHGDDQKCPNNCNYVCEFLCDLLNIIIKFFDEVFTRTITANAIGR